MKTYWHTATLFIEWGKHKWARKHDHCIECGTCDFPHKWNGLCTSCRDKQRANTPERIEQRARACLKWHKANYEYIPREEWKKRPTFLTPEDHKQYQHDWYMKNRPLQLLLKKIKARQKAGDPCMRMNINGVNKYFPFEWLEKPQTYDSKYYEWKMNMRDFDILREYYLK